MSGGAGRIFISYRREDTSATAGRLYDRLVARFGAGNVFMDVDSVAPGYDFAKAIATAVGSCQVVLAVIGTGWLDAADERGRRRLDDPDDFVVLEIQAGLERDIPVIPVLIDGAPGLRRNKLPAALASLARRQSLRVDHDSFTADVTRLLTAVERTFSPTEEPGPEPSDEAAAPPTRLVHTFAGGSGSTFYGVAFSSDMRLIAGASSRGTDLWELRSRTHVRTIRNSGRTVAVAFSATTDLLATANTGKSVQLWNPTSRAALRVLHGHTSSVTAVTFSPRGLLATGSIDGSARLWDPISGDQLHGLEGHSRGVKGVAFSRDGRLLAAVGDDKTVRLWESATGRPVHALVGHTKVVKAAAFSPGDDRLITAGADGTVRIWDSITGTGTVLVGGAGNVTSLAYRPDGRVLAAACTDKTVRLWDPTTGRSLGSLNGHSGVLSRKVNGVAFSPDGRYLASAGDDGTVRLWA